MPRTRRIAFQQAPTNKLAYRKSPGNRAYVWSSRRQAESVRITAKDASLSELLAYIVGLVGGLRASSPALAGVPWSLTEATTFSFVHGGHFAQSFIEQSYCTTREVINSSSFNPRSICLNGRITARRRPAAPNHTEVPLAANITVRVYILITKVSKGSSKEPNIREEDRCC